MSEERAWLVWETVLSMQERVEAELSRRLGSGSHLSCQDYKVLAALQAHPDGRMRLFELADALDWEKSRVSHQVSRMTRRGLLEKSQSPLDRRGAYVGPTAQAREAMAEAEPAYTRAVQRLLGETLTPAQLVALRDAAETVLAALTDIDAIDRHDSHPTKRPDLHTDVHARGELHTIRDPVSTGGGKHRVPR